MKPKPERWTLCARPRCPEVIPAGQRFCREHADGWARWKAENPGRSSGYGSQWRRARAAALDRAGHRCQVCGETQGLEVHHVDGRSPLDPGANAMTNLQVLCLRHHRRAEVERRRRQQQTR
jgi:5-methylcytosine-specific restriction endonuclease McrA